MGLTFPGSVSLTGGAFPCAAGCYSAQGVGGPESPTASPRLPERARTKTGRRSGDRTTMPRGARGGMRDWKPTYRRGASVVFRADWSAVAVRWISAASGLSLTVGSIGYLLRVPDLRLNQLRLDIWIVWLLIIIMGVWLLGIWRPWDWVMAIDSPRVLRRVDTTR
jgi:hypothetical protein